MFDCRGRSFKRRAIFKYFTVLSSSLPFYEHGDVCPAMRIAILSFLPLLSSENTIKVTPAVIEPETNGLTAVYP
jgi:hypothetical protein